MPVWHAATRDAREAGELVVVGITQEQHPDRTRLYAQWQEYDWPILWDPFNLTESNAVPIIVAVDEHGVVRAVNPRSNTFEDDFLWREFEAPAAARPKAVEAAAHLVELDRHAEGSFEHEHYRVLGDLLWRRDTEDEGGGLDEALEILEAQAEERPHDGRLAFHAGVARRMRYDSFTGRPEDFQVAIDHWTRALSIDPNQYIWRRRIQQYGPRMDKPYDFYTWVDQARRMIAERGEEPVELVAQLTPAELAQPRREFSAEAGEPDPDPDGRIERDTGLIALESAVAFDTSGRQPIGSLHLAFRPERSRKAHWNNVEPMEVWFDLDALPEGWQVEQRGLAGASVPAEVSNEVRRFSLDVKLSDGAREGSVAGYALYYVCEDVDGACLYRRQDFEIELALP